MHFAVRCSHVNNRINVTVSKELTSFYLRDLEGFNGVTKFQMGFTAMHKEFYTNS